jgi:molybdopterin synthase sulfur carrier subunit
MCSQKSHHRRHPGESRGPERLENTGFRIKSGMTNVVILDFLRVCQLSEAHIRMKVTVKLFASLRKDRFAVDERDYQDGATVGHILASLRIPEEEAAIIFINGRHAEPDSLLKEGDLLAIFPPVGGG